MEDNKIYYVMYNSYQIDDIEYGDPTPIYFSYDPKKVNDFFDEKVKNTCEYYKKTYPESFSIDELTGKSFSYWVDEWKYSYDVVSSPLEVDLRYVR